MSPLAGGSGDHPIKKKIVVSYAHFITHIRIPPKIVGFFRGWSGARALTGGIGLGPASRSRVLAFLFAFSSFTPTASRISKGVSIQLSVIAVREKARTVECS